MRKKRNIARKTKATKTSRIPATKSEPFALAEGHTSHSKTTVSLQMSTTASANGASEKSSHAHAAPANRDAPVVETEPFASAEGPGSLSTNDVPPLSQFRQDAQQPDGFVPQPSHEPRGTSQGDAVTNRDASTRPTEPCALAEGPGSPSTPEVPPIRQAEICCAGGFVLQSSHSPQATSHGDPIANRNRQNAQHSTGPRTAEGKARAAQNALKHGLSSTKHVILEWEDPEAFEALRDETFAIYEPFSAREECAVEEIAKARWSVLRCEQAEHESLDYLVTPMFRAADEHAPVTVASALCCTTLAHEANKAEKAAEDVEYWPALERVVRYRAGHERRLAKAIQEFDRARKERRAEATEQRKQEDDRRKQELHELRMAILAEKLKRESERSAKAKRQNEEQALNQTLDAYFNTPPPGLTMADLEALGFVSSVQAANTGATGFAGRTGPLT